MTHEEKEESVRRGQDAKQLLENPILHEAFERLEMAYTNEWKTSVMTETVRRETAYLMLVSLGDLRRQIDAFVTDGAITAARLKKL